MTLALISIAVFVATLVGGVFALRFRDRLHLILGFSAGAVAGVAIFDLLPEAFGLGMQYNSVSTISLFVAFGFFGYLILDRFILLHTHDDESDASVSRGSFGALTLSTHSLVDGIAVGFGFQTSTSVGIIVAIAVLAHDFSDGINTVNFILKNDGGWKKAFRWLLIDAIAPAIGIALTLFLTVPSSMLGLILALFAGTFIYLSASDLIPESHHRHPRALTTFMTLFGAMVIYTITLFV